MAGIDRLSELPDAVLHKILSLLDTKIVVQTSILSRRWRLIWKDVPVLNFYQASFGTLLQFEQHVDQVLALRSNCHLVKISTNFQVTQNKNLFVRIMRYAASHNIQHLCVLRFYGHFLQTILSDSVAAMSICYESLGVLELQYADFYEATFEALSRLKMLKTLTLSMCEFCFDGVSEQMDPFAKFSKLENLKVVHCHTNDEGSGAIVRVSGSQLLTLEIHQVLFKDIEIFAPKVESFSYWAEISDMEVTIASRINLPSLKHATINLWSWKGSHGRNYPRVRLRQCVRLFDSLRNTNSVNLHLDTSELLLKICHLVEEQPSRFERMKSLNLTVCCEGRLSIPYRVTRYFLEGSLEMEDKLVIAKKVPNWCDPDCCLHLQAYDDAGPPRREV